MILTFNIMIFRKKQNKTKPPTPGRPRSLAEIMEINIQLSSYCTLWQLVFEQQGQQKGMCIHILATQCKDFPDRSAYVPRFPAVLGACIPCASSDTAGLLSAQDPSRACWSLISGQQELPKPGPVPRSDTATRFPGALLVFPMISHQQEQGTGWLEQLPVMSLVAYSLFSKAVYCLVWTAPCLEPLAYHQPHRFQI